MLRRALAAAVLIAAALLLPAPPAAAQALPPDVARILDSALRDAQNQTRRDRQVDSELRAAGLPPAVTAAGPGYVGDIMGGAVVEAIGRRPDLAGPIVARAVGALPEARPGIVASASAAYPGFAPTIRAAAGNPGAAASAAPPPAARPVAYAPTPYDPPPPPRQVAAAAPMPAAAPAPIQVAQAAPAQATPAKASAPAKGPPGQASGVNAPAGTVTVGDDDPWEGFNRGVFAVNDVIDRFLLRPIAVGYGWIMPDPAKRAVRNMFANAMSPTVFANDLLQLDFRDAGITLSRLVANSTMGIGGLFDVADGMGLPAHPADFGQTLYSYGVNPGPYLVLPLLGPSTVRDGIGTGVDMALHPFPWLLPTEASMGITGARAIVKREDLVEPLDQLRESLLDYYAALRSAWRQDRAVQLQKGQPVDSQKLDQQFDEFQ